MKLDATLCPDLELLAAYVDRTADRQDRQWISRHALECEICAFVLSEAARIRRPIRGWFVTRWLARLATLARC